MRKASLLLLLWIASTHAWAQPAAQQIDFGTVENSVYRNEYFGLRVPLPAGWAVQDRAGQQRIIDTGSSTIAGDDKNRKAMLDAAALQTVPLVAAFRHPIGAPVTYNAGFMCLAERVAHIPAIQRGKDYHLFTRRVLEMSPAKVSYPREISTESIGGRAFDVMYVQLEMAGMRVQQKYYATVLKGYALGCITSYVSAEDEAALNRIVGALSFK